MVATRRSPLAMVNAFPRTGHRAGNISDHSRCRAMTKNPSTVWANSLYRPFRYPVMVRIGAAGCGGVENLRLPVSDTQASSNTAYYNEPA